MEWTSFFKESFPGLGFLLFHVNGSGKYSSLLQYGNNYGQKNIIWRFVQICVTLFHLTPNDTNNAIKPSFYGLVLNNFIYNVCLFIS
jgi:hypothetical protein